MRAVLSWAFLWIVACRAGAFGQPQAQQQELSAAQILAKALEVYASTPTYSAEWSYTMERSRSEARATVTIQAKGGRMLLFHVARSSSKVQDEELPELKVVVDGKSAVFQNATARIWYRVPLPADARITPLMFLPQVPTARGVNRGPDITEGRTRCYTVWGTSPDGAVTRMVVDAKTFRIRTIVNEVVIGLDKVTSTLAVVKEEFGKDLADALFEAKVPPGFKEIPAPSEAKALFGVADAKPVKP
ncbi:MAG: LolA family protein [Chthonomonadales bacterium]